MNSIEAQMELIPDFEYTDQNDLCDLLTIMAKNVEKSLVASGATPGKDYTYLDLYQLAAPFALEVFRSREDITFHVANRK